METVSIHDPNSGAAARIAVGLGFNCFEFRVPHKGETLDVLYADDGFPAGNLPPTRSGIPLLFPFPNRVREGRFQWDGKTYELTADRVGYDPAGVNAIHGFALDRPWRVIEQHKDCVTGEFRLSVDAPERRDLWPCDCCLRVTYRVKDRSLQAQIEIVNPEDVPMPWGFGTHPYFAIPFAPGGKPDEHLITVPARRAWQLQDCLPDGQQAPLSQAKNLQDGQPFGGLQLDDVLTDLPDGAEGRRCSIMDPTAGLEIVQTCDEAFREIVVFTPPTRKSVCIEPYTCVTDAVNLETQGVDAGWRTLGPHQSLKLWIEIAANPVLA